MPPAHVIGVSVIVGTSVGVHGTGEQAVAVDVGVGVVVPVGVKVKTVVKVGVSVSWGSVFCSTNLPDAWCI